MILVARAVEIQAVEVVAIRICLVKGVLLLIRAMEVYKALNSRLG